MWASPDKLWTSFVLFCFLFFELKGVRVFIIIMKIIIMMMMIKKKKKNFLQMLHFHPHVDTPLHSCHLRSRPWTEECQHPRVFWFRVLSPHSVGTPSVPEQLSLVRQEADAARTLDADTSGNAPRKTACFSFLARSLFMVTPLCCSVGINAMTCRQS